MHIDSAHVPVGQHARQFATLQLFPTSPDRRRSNAQAGDGRTGCYLVDGDIKATFETNRNGLTLRTENPGVGANAPWSEHPHDRRKVHGVRGGGGTVEKGGG